MNPKKIWANMAVEDIVRTTKFYSEIGFLPNGTPTQDITSFKVGNENFIMHFFTKSSLEKGLKGIISDSLKENEIIFTLSAESKSEVDQWANEIKNAGGILISTPEEFGTGYYGFVFADPDGHRYNVFLM